MTDLQADVKLVTLTDEDLGKVQMLCGHSPTYRDGYEAKVEWLGRRLQEGMRYTLLQVHGRNAGMDGSCCKSAWNKPAEQMASRLLQAKLIGCPPGKYS